MAAVGTKVARALRQASVAALECIERASVEAAETTAKTDAVRAAVVEAEVQTKNSFAEIRARLNHVDSAAADTHKGVAETRKHVEEMDRLLTKPGKGGSAGDGPTSKPGKGGVGGDEPTSKPKGGQGGQGEGAPAYPANPNAGTDFVIVETGRTSKIPKDGQTPSSGITGVAGSLEAHIKETETAGACTVA